MVFPVEEEAESQPFEQVVVQPVVVQPVEEVAEQWLFSE